VVEDVEKIRSRLQRKPLPEFELPPQRQINLSSAESAQGISSQGSLPRRGGYAECRSIDSLSAGYFRMCNQQWYCGNQIRTLHAGGSGQDSLKGWLKTPSFGRIMRANEQGWREGQAL